MDPALRLAKSLVEPVVRLIMTDRRKQHDRSRPLSELVNVTLLDDYQRRRFRREVESMTDAVAQRLQAFAGREWEGLADNDRYAALAAVIETFEEADFSDKAFLASDADPHTLARSLHTQLIACRAGLSGAGTALYERLVKECCVIYTQLAVHLPSFAPRGITELLKRSGSLSAEVELVLQRLPIRSVDAPMGTDLDEEFLNRYMTHVSNTLDTIELFGLDGPAKSQDGHIEGAKHDGSTKNKHSLAVERRHRNSPAI